MEQNGSGHGLPENAFRELKPGESYEPVIAPKSSVLEVTVRSVLFGLAMGIFFSAASTFIILKLGQGIETTIPIAILAVGFSAGMGILKRRNSTLLENINILSVGGTAGIIAGGSVFTMPAIYILGLEARSSFFQIMIVPFFGAVLGVLFLIPFRRYFVAQMHGKLPFPEGTAIAESLMAGERGGREARVLAGSLGVGFLVDFAVMSFRVWSDTFSTAAIKGMSYFTNEIKAVFALNTSAAVAGLGYLIGVRYAAIILAGSMLSTLVIVPLVAYFGNYMSVPTAAHLPLISTMSADDIFSEYARYIGIGGIFVAGVLGIVKLSKVILSAFTEGARGLLKSKGAESSGPVLRTEQDISMRWVLAMFSLTTLLLWLYFRFAVLHTMEDATLYATISVVVTIVIAFLFTSVSAWAVAMISVTPISGMTLMTLIVSSVILVSVGLKGEEGMLAVLLIGGVVCTALSMAGTLITEFKLGFWMGATPKKIQWANILACIVAAAVVTAVMMLLNSVYGFTASPEHANPLPAPQPNAMAAVLSSLMGGQETPWLLYAIGGLIAIIVEMLGISSLAFALGMYLPIELNSPILLGAVVSWFVKRSSKNEELSKARHNRGLLVASGLLAGGALAGVMDALVKYVTQSGFGMADDALYLDFGSYAESFGNWMGLAAFLWICYYMFWNSSRATVEPHS
ncbi:MAG: oligopeptide transporter, OPT family [Myxococcota bacterium]|nr:oligopeptide transporter, OPT family [Myxococcota bacterium]